MIFKEKIKGAEKHLTSRTSRESLARIADGTIMNNPRQNICYSVLVRSIIKSGSLKDTVLIAIYEPLRNSHVCDVSTLDKDYRPVGNGMVFAKGWAYTELFNYHFLKVRMSY